MPNLDNRRRLHIVDILEDLKPKMAKSIFPVPNIKVEFILITVITRSQCTGRDIVHASSGRL